MKPKTKLKPRSGSELLFCNLCESYFERKDFSKHNEDCILPSLERFDNWQDGQKVELTPAEFNVWGCICGLKRRDKNV